MTTLFCRHFFWLTILLLTACSESEEKIFPKTTFDSPFPKRNYDITNIFGNQLSIKTPYDTLTLNISATKKSNLITNRITGDTLFFGVVCRFRGLYYFNQQLNDSSYWIYAVKINDNLIYGFNSALGQTLLVDRAIENGLHKKLVKYISTDRIRLHPDKKELKNLFSAIIDSISPDTIIMQFNTTYTNDFNDTTGIARQIDPEDYLFLSKIYPNPATDFVIIELQQKNKITYQLTDINGKTVLEGRFIDTKNKIDLTGQVDGIYLLTLVNLTDNHKEVTKIVKTN